MIYFLRIAACAAAIAALALAVVSQPGCGSGDGLVRGPVKGRVTVGGQPLAKGRILFLPAAPNQGPTVSAAIVGGEYSLSHREGPIAGPNRVEVEADPDLGFAIDDEAAFAQRGGGPLPQNPVPAAFNRDSKLVCDIQADADNEFNVTVPGAAHTAARPAY